ncbi:SDR family oxidoreductase [Leucobacter triazinivorans]|uniref:SDR family oxidoreductase n=1 Tax=Leucobacter triazinivorans TaxID=1784719 RepID=UPI00197CC499|nr:3-beta hydroxysteroid dehydrogenase [Leucobacter triazinivorans]
MRIAIAGGTGTVGAHAVRLAEEAGHETIVLSRANGVDLVLGRGLDLTGVDAVIDVSGTSTTSASKATGFFEAVTSTLHRAEREAGVGHHVALSIVGAAAAPHGYYAGKAAQERAVAAGPVPWTILRATQFFEFAEQVAVPLGAWRIVPAMRSQPVAAASVAARLVRLAEHAPAGDAPDLAGPAEMRMAELLRRVSAARGRPARVIELPLPGGFGRALRNGAVLPGPDAQLDGVSVDEWLGEVPQASEGQG